MSMKFSTKVRIYYKDTDAGGVVYHTRYAEFMEIARTEMLRQVGLTAQDLVTEYGLLCPVVEMSLKFKSPARYDDLITVQVTIIELSATRLICEYEIVNQSGTLLITARTTNCAVSENKFKVTQFPPALIEALSSKQS